MPAEPVAYAPAINVHNGENKTSRSFVNFFAVESK